MTILRKGASRIRAAAGAATAPPDCPVLPPVIGHRGAAASAPENTLAGFRRAAALGCRWIEFDARLTGDGAIVVLHDSRLERTTDGSGRVVRLPLAAIRRHDAGGWFAPAFTGEPVPTLDEALALLSELGLGANIELKAARGHARATAAAVAAALQRRAPAERPPVLLSSFHAEALAAARDLAPHVARGVLFRAVPRHWRGIAARLGCATIHANHQRLQPTMVATIRDAGYPLLAFTVNDAARARTLFDWGVTSVFSDAPDIILAAIADGGKGSVAGERQGVMR
jgi:glycerophosphoryl diester phosphodiesterase